MTPTSAVPLTSQQLHPPLHDLVALSPIEARFERWRRTVGLFAGPVAFALIWWLPLPGLSVEAHRLAAVVTLVVMWWVSEAIPIAATALLGAALTVVCGIATPNQAFAPFASPTIFLFMGSFMIGQAIVDHRLDRRLAAALLRLPMVGGDVNRMYIALGAMTLLVSGWMSNTATTAMMVPIALGVIGASSRSSAGPEAHFRRVFLLTIAYAASIGGMMTPVGSPPNLITLGLLDKVAGVRVTFFEWMILAAPISLTYGALLLVVGRRSFKGRAQSVIRRVDTPEPDERAWTAGQRNCALAFAFAVTLWILPGLFAITGFSARPGGLLSRLDEGTVAILAALLLFVLPVDWRQRTFTLQWSSASRIDWGTILLFGGGLSLGQLMFSTGLAARLGEAAVQASGAESLWAVTAIATLVGLLLSEVTSNTAATSMLVPVVLSITTAAGLNPVPPAVGACLGASLSFMFPISTPPNAIVYGTGMVPITTMMLYGIAMDAIGFVLIVGGLWLLCPMLGFV